MSTINGTLTNNFREQQILLIVNKVEKAKFLQDRGNICRYWETLLRKRNYTWQECLKIVTWYTFKKLKAEFWPKNIIKAFEISLLYFNMNLTLAKNFSSSDNSSVKTNYPFDKPTNAKRITNLGGRFVCLRVFYTDKTSNTPMVCAVVRSPRIYSRRMIYLDG